MNFEDFALLDEPLELYGKEIHFLFAILILQFCDNGIINKWMI